MEKDKRLMEASWWKWLTEGETGFCSELQGDKKVFLSDQCKKIEENNRMGKSRDLFKKIRDTKENFHA